jgi:hypothetical protein
MLVACRLAAWHTLWRSRFRSGGQRRFPRPVDNERPRACDGAGNRGCGVGQSAERRRLRGYPAGRGLTAR